jgi:hypothetical protein
MKTDWKCVTVIIIAFILGASLLAPLATAARVGGGGRAGGFGGGGHIGGFGGGIGDRSFAGAGRGGFDRVGPGIGDRDINWHGNDWDLNRWHGHLNYWGGGFPAYGSAYGYGYPAAYPVFVPANYGGNQGTCYEACVNSGQYSPSQCGQMCYTAR